jgi:hypothetical protein
MEVIILRLTNYNKKNLKFHVLEVSNHKGPSSPFEVVINYKGFEQIVNFVAFLLCKT